jgi:Zierdtviridae exonuclease
MTELPILHTSERSSFRRCPWQWKQRYIEGLVPALKQSDARWFGIGIHLALAEWYKKGKRRGPHPADTFHDWYDEEIAGFKIKLDDEFDTAVWEDAYTLGIAMLEGYVSHYGKDSQWQVIVPERPISVKVTRAGEPIALFRSRWDGVVRDLDTGRIYLLEHKTASQIQLPYLEIDDQAGIYWAVAGPVLRADRTLGMGEEIAGIIYNFLRKAMPDERPQNELGQYLNKDGSVSKQQGSPRFVRHLVERSPKEQHTQMNRLADEVAVMNGMRSGAIPIWKTTTKDCTFCDFFDVCRLDERGNKRAFNVLVNSTFDRTDPYADDRKSATVGG